MCNHLLNNVQGPHRGRFPWQRNINKECTKAALSSVTTYSAMCKILSPHSQAFPPSSFLLLAVCKNGESLGAYQVCTINVYLDRQKREGPSNKNTHFVHVFFVLYNKQQLFCIVNVLNSKHTDQHCKKKPQTTSFIRGPRPPLCLSW